MSRLTFCLLFVAVFSSIEAHSGKSSLETSHGNVNMRKRMLIIFRIPKIPNKRDIAWLITAGSRRLLEEENETVWDDAREGITSAVDQFWGGECVSSSQCTDYVATCSQSVGQYHQHNPPSPSTFPSCRRVSTCLVDVGDPGLHRPLPGCLLYLLHLLRHLLLHHGLFMLLSLIQTKY